MKFLNTQLQQYAHNSSSNNFRDQLKAWSKLIGFWQLWPVNQHNSKLTIELLQDLKQYNKCDYGLTTTQQQNHRFSEGFKFNKNVIMVSQPHNSKLTIELLKDFKFNNKCDYGLTATQQRSHNRQPAGFKANDSN